MLLFIMPALPRDVSVESSVCSAVSPPTIRVSFFSGKPTSFCCENHGNSSRILLRIILTLT